MDFLTGENLANAIKGYTIIDNGGKWAEFYDPNGKIFGKGREDNGNIKKYEGNWTVVDNDKIKYDYGILYNTKSSLILNGDTITFYEDGKRKKKRNSWGYPTNVDADVAVRKLGNALGEFK